MRFQVSGSDKPDPMDIDHIFQTALHSHAIEDSELDSWKVLLRLPSKVIRFSLSADECREPRTISWLNNEPKKQLVRSYHPSFPGFRKIKDVEIIMEDQKVLSYDSYFLNIEDVIFSHDEYHTMGDNNQAKALDAKRITPDGIEIITKAIGDTIYHLNGHVYKFNASLSQNHFIPMTNVLIRKLENRLPTSSQQAATQFAPFLALNRNYIEGFSILFKGSKGIS